MVFESLTAILSIVVIDLVLSGDNAVVIGMAARSLSPENRRKAIVLGGAGAIGLRIVFTALAALLLGIPGLQAIGGILLLFIAFKLIRPQGDEHETVQEAGSLGEAVRTIILADVVMSLDNILAVGGAAKGHLGLLMFGLLLSIPIILFGSELVARLLGRFPAFLYVGVYVLVHAAVTMLLHDPSLPVTIELTVVQELLLSLVVTLAIVGMAKVLERRRRSRHGREVAVSANGAGPHEEQGRGAAEARLTVRQGDESSRTVST